MHDKKTVQVARGLGLAGAITLTGCIVSVFSGNYALAQITPDATLGAEGSIVTPLDAQGLPVDRIDGGAIRGTNLFHSFLEFNVATDRGAYFFSPANMENILTRVTGSNPSQILGTLGTFGASSPNLFLINPNGIIFGQNASLDVGGSFVASTASSIKLADGTEFSAANPIVPPLLTISVPLGLQFNGNEANIVTSSGLEVQPGQTLALVGGQVSLQGATLIAPGGGVEIGGLAAPGTVGLNLDPVSGNLGSLTFPSGVTRANVEIVNGTNIDVSSAGGGSIAINARNLSILGTTVPNYLSAGIAQGQGFPGAKAGDITLNATEAITVNASEISNIVDGTGNAGNVNITTGTLSLTNNAGLGSLTFGRGNAGNVRIIADKVSLDEAFIGTIVLPGGVGNAGDVTINARTLSLTNGAQVNSGIQRRGRGNAGSVTITADTVSLNGEGASRTAVTSLVERGAEGNGGTVTINTGTLSLTNGAVLSSTTSGKGNAGNVTINADIVSFDGKNRNGFPGGASSYLGSTAEGKGGNVTINARTLSLTNGAGVSSGTFGKGDAGNVTINADTVSLDNNAIASSSVENGATGNAGNVTITARALFLTNGSQVNSATFAKGDAGSVTITADTISLDGSGSNGFNSAVSSSVDTEAEGNGGKITITARTLSLTNGAQVGSATFGKGDAGSVTISADTVSIDGEDRDGGRSGVSNSVQRGAVGNGGTVTINAESLSLTNGAGVSSDTFGQGKAGNVTITADTVSLEGTDREGNFSIVSSSVGRGAVGNGGNITLNAGTLSLTNGGAISVRTLGEGDAGTIEINANTIEAASGGLILSDTSTDGRAGDIIIQARERFTLSGANTGVFADTEEGSTGIGGSIKLASPEVTLSDRAAISVSSKGAGVGGNIEIQADTLTLQNEARLLAETASNRGGDITLQLQDLLLLRNQSRISTTAGTDQAGGDGGNITIEASEGFIVAVPKENSDITANAFQGRGGNINITATGIYGIDFRPRLTPLSDITASSEIGVDGIVDINTSGIDPVRGIVNLPTEPVNTEVTQDCQTGGGKASGSFINTGRGGLPTHPYEPLSSNDLLADVQAPRQWVENSTSAASTSTLPTPKRLVEATGWIINENGEVVLVAEVPPISSEWSCRLR